MSYFVCVVCALVSVTSLPPVMSLPTATSLPPETSLPHLTSLAPETSLSSETSLIPETSFIPVTSLPPVMSLHPVTSLAVPTSNSKLIVQPDEPPEPVVSEISLLEEEIKHSLRKDNDDYLLELQRGAVPPPAPLPARRFHNEPLTPINPLTNAPIYSLPPGMKYHDARKLAQRSKPRRTTHKPRDRMTAGHREGQANRIKSFDKKQRLFLYTSSTKISPSLAPLELRSYSPPKIMRSSPPKMPSIPTKQVERIEFLPHKPWGTHAPEDRRPPNADQLDMAPARGAYIHNLRLKGRFCHRHVLWPEGPKYNSKGNVIMPAFNAGKYNKGKDFSDTTKAMFLLPRCCNCCKKSVLGCQ